MSQQPLGVTGFIELNGQRYDFAHMISQFPSTQATFPASEGPRSIVTGQDETQRNKYTTAYQSTDEYVQGLLDNNIKANDGFSEKATQLSQLTHCLHQTRQETDHVFTMIMNKSFPTKRTRGNEDSTVTNTNTDPNINDSHENKKNEENNIDNVTMIDGDFEETEAIKRQRALDTTEYFSGSEDEGDEDVSGNEKVQL